MQQNTFHAVCKSLYFAVLALRTSSLYFKQLNSKHFSIGKASVNLRHVWNSFPLFILEEC